MCMSKKKQDNKRGWQRVCVLYKMKWAKTYIGVYWLCKIFQWTLCICSVCNKTLFVWVTVSVCVCVSVCGPQADSDSSVLAICWQSHQEKATAAKQWRAMTGQDLWGAVYVCAHVHAFWCGVRVFPSKIQMSPPLWACAEGRGCCW